MSNIWDFGDTQTVVAGNNYQDKNNFIFRKNIDGLVKICFFSKRANTTDNTPQVHKVKRAR